MDIGTGGPNARSVVGLLISLMVLVGCRPGEDIEPGPLDAGFEDSGLTCLPPSESTDFTFGSNVLRYNGSKPLTITKVDLIVANSTTPRGSAQEFQVAEALVVPVSAKRVGSWPRWPPPRGSIALSGSRPAVGAAMSRSGVTEYNLVAHVTREDASRPVVATYIRLFYTVGGTEWGSVGTWTLGVRSRSGSCE